MHVYCYNANLTILPRKLPFLSEGHYTYKLNFSNNRLLSRLEHRGYFANTSTLDVSNCGIDRVENWKELFSLNYVYLHGNRLTPLPRLVATLDVFPQYLSLYNNPWSCYCEDSWMARWLSSVSQHLLNPNYISCASPIKQRGKNILQNSDDEFCEDHVMRSLFIGIASVIVVLLIVSVIGVIVYRVRVKLYTRCTHLYTRCKLHPFDRDECLGEDIDYDVFISCSSVDDLPHGDGIRE